MKTYHVEYKEWFSGEIKGVDVVARNAMEAYDKATYDKIPEIEGCLPYSSWVKSVTYSNGNYKEFKTFEGNPY